jgi:hypothetical protein
MLTMFGSGAGDREFSLSILDNIQARVLPGGGRGRRTTDG